MKYFFGKNKIDGSWGFEITKDNETNTTQSEFVEISESEYKELFRKQSQGYQIKENNGKPIAEKYEPSLDELKTEKRSEINQARDNAEQGGFEYMGKIFDSDQVSCQRISCAAQAMSVLTMSAETPTITWTCQDNTTIDLSASELMGLVVALAQWSNSCHEKATALKAQIDACTGKEELDAITWE